MSIITEQMVLEKEQQNTARREAINKRLAKAAYASDPEPNFPPECCCIKPLIYHNIRKQVPVPQQRFMYIVAGLYTSLVILIIYNIVSAGVALLFGGSAMHFGLSFLYLLGLPGAWMVWYYNVYCAIVYSSRPRQLLALVGLLLGVGFDAWMAVGVTGLGGCGWIYALSLSGELVRFVLVLVCASLWSLHCAALVVILIRYWVVSASLLRDAANIYRQSIV